MEIDKWGWVLALVLGGAGMIAGVHQGVLLLSVVVGALGAIVLYPTGWATLSVPDFLKAVRSWLVSLRRLRLRLPLYRATGEARHGAGEGDELVASEPINRFREIVDCCRGPMDGTAKLLREACDELRENSEGWRPLIAWILTHDHGFIRRYEEVSARLNNKMTPPGREMDQERFHELKALFVEYHRRHYNVAQAYRKVVEALYGPEFFWLDDEYDSLRRAHLRCRDKLHEARSHSELSGLLGAIHHQVGFVWNLFPRRNHSHQQELQALYDEGQRIRERWPSPGDDFEVQGQFVAWARRVVDYLDQNIKQGSVQAFGGRFVEQKTLLLNESELRERLDERMRRLDTIIQRLSTQ